MSDSESNPSPDGATSLDRIHMLRQMEQVSVRGVSATELETVVPGLRELFTTAVNAGASLGFVAAPTALQCREYWLSLGTKMRSGARLLFVATIDTEVVGSAQLKLPLGPAARHRAEVHKLVVHPAMHGRGIGKALMASLHLAAIEHGRSLVVTAARRGEAAERFYKQLDYHEGGVIAGYTMGPSGQRFDVLSLYRQFIV